MTTSELATRILNRIECSFSGFHSIEIEAGKEYFSADIEVIANFSPSSYEEETNYHYEGKGYADFTVSNAMYFDRDENYPLSTEEVTELETELKNQSRI